MHPESIYVVGGEEFVKLRPYNVSFVRFVCVGSVERLPKNATLCQSRGLKELIRLRNAACSPETSAPVRALFADAAKPTTRRRVRGASVHEPRQNHREAS